MRGRLLSLFLFAAVLVPRMGSAQAYSLPTPPPAVTAASAGWQILGEPLFYAGNFYYPSGPDVFFDGNVMRRTGVYLGVPLYADTTLGPYAAVFVPIGSNMMRPYVPRTEPAPGTPVSGSAWYAFEPATQLFETAVQPSGSAAAAVAPAPLIVPETYELVATSGRLLLRPTDAVAPAPYEPTTIQSIPPPTTNEGVWIDYDGARWYLSGVAAPYDPDRFTPIGTYEGFPVYRETSAPSDTPTIYVSVVQDGPVVPYMRRGL